MYMKSLKPVIYCAALIGAAVALVRPLGAQYVERFRAVVTDTNGIVVSHADIELATGEKLSSSVQPGDSITNLTGYGSAALAASNDFARSSVWGYDGTNATITATGGGIVGLWASSAGVGGIAIGDATTAGNYGAAFGYATTAGDNGAAFGYVAAAGDYGFAAGYYCEGGPGSFIYSDPGLTFDRSAITNGFSVRASGGTYFETPTFEVTGRFTGDAVGGDASRLPNVAGNAGLSDGELIAWKELPGQADHGLYSVAWSNVASMAGLGTAALADVETNEVPEGYFGSEYTILRANSRDVWNADRQTHIVGWSKDHYEEWGATAYTAEETRRFLGLDTTNDVTFASVNAEGITSTAANTNTAATVWRSSGNETKASIDNETGAVVVRGEDSDLRYFAGGFRIQNANYKASAFSSPQYTFMSPTASNLREVTILWAMDTNSVHDGIVARIGPARSRGTVSPYIEIQLQTNSVITTSGTVRYYSQTFSTNYNGSATAALTAPGAWGFLLYNGSAGVATNLGAIVQIECASE